MNKIQLLIKNLFFSNYIILNKDDLAKELLKMQEEVDLANKRRGTNYKLESYDIESKFIYITKLLKQN